MTTPEQQAPELRAVIADLTNECKALRADLARTTEVLMLFRAGIDAGLVEIEALITSYQFWSAASENYGTAAKGMQAAVDIIRKHTGVKP